MNRFTEFLKRLWEGPYYVPPCPETDGVTVTLNVQKDITAYELYLIQEAEKTGRTLGKAACISETLQLPPEAKRHLIITNPTP